MTLQLNLPDSLDRDALMEAARGRRAEVSRAAALRSLVRDPGPAFPLMEEVLFDEDDAPRFRHMAALALYRLGTDEAHERLLEAGRRVRDPRTLATVARGLGLQARDDALEVVEGIRDRTEGFPRRQAEFAAAVIAHAHDLDGHDIEAPAEGDLLELEEGARQREVETGAPGSEEDGRLRRGLEEEPVGVDLVPDQATEIACRPGTLQALVPSAALAGDGAAGTLRSRRTVAGVVAARPEVKERYSLSRLALTRPGRPVRLTLHRLDGTLTAAGEIEAEGGAPRFRLRNARRPGAVAIRLSGTLEDGRLRPEEAESGTDVAVAQRTPSREG